jgi:hypothetical protein
MVYGVMRQPIKLSKPCVVLQSCLLLAFMFDRRGGVGRSKVSHLQARTSCSFAMHGNSHWLVSSHQDKGHGSISKSHEAARPWSLRVNHSVMMEISVIRSTKILESTLRGERFGSPLPKSFLPSSFITVGLPNPVTASSFKCKRPPHHILSQPKFFSFRI